MLILSLGYATMNNIKMYLNPLKAKLNPICHLLALLGAHPIFHVSRIRVKGKWCEVVERPGVLGFCEFIYDPFCL